MEGALKTAVMQAGWASRDFLAYAASSLCEGVTSIDIAVTMLGKVKEMTKALSLAMTEGDVLPEPVSSLLRDCLIDMEALSELGDLLLLYESTPVNALHMIEACRYTARRVVGELAVVDHMLRDL